MPSLAMSFLFFMISERVEASSTIRDTRGVRGKQEDTSGSPPGEGFEMFCPYCANLLVVEPFGGAMRFACKTCPYHYNIGKRLKKAAHIEQKKVAYSRPVCLSVCPSVFLACLLADWLGLCVSLLSLISLFPPRHT